MTKEASNRDICFMKAVTYYLILFYVAWLNLPPPTNMISVMERLFIGAKNFNYKRSFSFGTEDIVNHRKALFQKNYEKQNFLAYFLCVLFYRREE